MNNRTVIFFDIDGTLFSPKTGIPASTLEALSRLKEKNTDIVICTGRARSMVPQSIISIGFNGIIAGAGTYVEINEKTIHEINLENKDSSNLLEDIRHFGLIPILEGHSISYYDDETADESYRNVLNHYFREAKPYMKPIPKDYSHLNIAKASARFTENGDSVSLMAKYKDKYNIVCHGNVLIEFIPKYSSKAKGIEEYLKYTDIPIENTYAFGDSMNDYEMLKYVNYGVAMGNSCTELKSITKYITDDINEDGIYNALVKFGLI